MPMVASGSISVSSSARVSSFFSFFTPIDANQRLKRLEEKNRNAATRMTRKSPVTMGPNRFSAQFTT